MTNEQLIKKMKEDMKMRNFSKYTYDSYLGKSKDIMRYYGVMYEVTLDKLLNKKQLPMKKKKKAEYKVLTKEELSAFFMYVIILNLERYLC